MSIQSASKKEWSFDEASTLFSLPVPDLLYRAQTAHRNHFSPDVVHVSTLLSIKTGNCPEDCAYCAQSSRNKTGVQKEPLMDLQDVLEAAKRAKAAGSTRLCMGASGRGPRTRELDRVCEMIREVKKLGLEACVTLGLLDDEQAQQLKEAGLDYYNHNLDTSEKYYGKIITTRTFQDRLDTLERVRKAGIRICCGGILGLGESNDDRISLLVTLANFAVPPDTVPINRLIRLPGTALEHIPDVDSFDFVRTIALARILMPRTYIRLSAGRETMSDELQTLCFLAGANAIFFGEKLLTTANTTPENDNDLLRRLGLRKAI